MNRPLLIAGAVATVAAMAFYQADSAFPPLAKTLPSGALLVIESKKLPGLLAAWNGSAEKDRWLKSANFEAFINSNVAQKLAGVRDSYGEAAGFEPGFSLAEGLAGDDAALALYDIREVEFVYVTRLPMARVTESALWRVRDRFDSRQSAGLPFYVRNSPDGKRTVAFALVKDHLFVATREDLMARSLALLAGGSELPLSGEDWYTAAAKAGGAPGDIRLTLHLEELIQTRAFRSNWVQRNRLALEPYWTGVVDLFRQPNEIRESRRFLMKDYQTQTLPSTEDRKALAEAWRLVPETAGYARGWASPSSENIIAVLTQKMLDPQTASDSGSYLAPGFSQTPNAPGSESDFEKRIDEAPLPEAKSGFEPAALIALLNANSPQALLVTQSSRSGPQGNFLETPAAVVIAGASNWDGAKARTAITASIAQRWTTTTLGAAWRPGSDGAYEMDGLRPLAMAAQGRLLIIATDAATLAPLLSRLGNAQVSGSATGLARFNHDRERLHFKEWMNALDTESAPPSGSLVPLAGLNGQKLFSGNFVSLSEVLQSVKVEETESEARPGVLWESVRYKLGL